MQHDAPLETSAPAGDGESTRRTVPSRRARLALGFAVALAIVTGAWYVGGRQGFDQIGRGGIDRDGVVLAELDREEILEHAYKILPEQDG